MRNVFFLLVALIYATMLNANLEEKQWYLKENYLDVMAVWKEGIDGSGVTVCVIDDGVDFEHPAIKDSFEYKLAYDFTLKKNLSLPTTEADSHGTKCTGQIVACPESICGRGIAYGSRVTGLKILSRFVSDNMEQKAIVHGSNAIDIYSCSWGPPDDGKSVDGPSKNVLEAFIEGILMGRHGKGNIYVFACGNGSANDNCSFDGYTNLVFTITIGAIDCCNRTFEFQKECPALLCVTYSSGLANDEETANDSQSPCPIYTTSIDGKCSTNHGGTSAAAPFATGIFALALSIRPDLTWRDMQYLCVETAIQISPPEVNKERGIFVKNGAGKNFSTFFGFGRLSAKAFIDKAKNWKLVKQGGVVISDEITFNSGVIALANSSLFSAIEIKSYSFGQQVEAVENVSIMLSLAADVRGEMEIYLQSPSKTTIRMASRRPKDLSTEGLRRWSMMTVGFWGETLVDGLWTLVIKSTSTNNQIELQGWRLAVWGPLKERISTSSIKDQYIHAYE